MNALPHDGSGSVCGVWGRSHLCFCCLVPSSDGIAFVEFGLEASDISYPGFQFFHNVVVNDTKCYSIVGLNWCGRLRMT